MLYQKLLTGNKPYFISEVRRPMGFQNHRHPEVEFYYCINGQRSLLIDKKQYALTAGSLVLIGSMNAHESTPAASDDCRALAIKVGPVFLAEHFDALATFAQENPILQLSPKEPLYRLMEEIIQCRSAADPFAELALKGLLYQFCATLLHRFDREKHPAESNDLRAVFNVEQALELIYHDYSSRITVRQAAKQCGYSESSFCRVFKRVTGKTFHEVLNHHRVEIACELLKKTDLSIEEIAGEVGFSDIKSFCRVFKSEMGITAGTFRQNS